MTNISSVARERIEAQGFCGLDDGLLSQINYPLRLAPAICMTWALVGIVLGSPAVIGSIVPFAILGAVLPGHPFDVIYNFGLRHIFKRSALPRYAKRRRLACVAASTALTVSAAQLSVWRFAFGICTCRNGGCRNAVETSVPASVRPRPSPQLYLAGSIASRP